MREEAKGGGKKLQCRKIFPKFEGETKSTEKRVERVTSIFNMATGSVVRTLGQKKGRGKRESDAILIGKTLLGRKKVLKRKVREEKEKSGWDAE